MRLGEHLDADDRLSIRDGELYLEECSLAELARRFGTPLNVVSQERLQRRAHEFTREFGEAWSEGPVQVLPSLKANFSLALRRLLTLEGLGCDTFGFGELRAALACGVPPELISVNGSSKSPALIRAAVAGGAHLTLDSLREVRLAVAVAAEEQTSATIRLRLRPDYGSSVGSQRVRRRAAGHRRGDGALQARHSARRPARSSPAVARIRTSDGRRLPRPRRAPPARPGHVGGGHPLLRARDRGLRRGDGRRVASAGHRHRGRLLAASRPCRVEPRASRRRARTRRAAPRALGGQTTPAASPRPCGESSSRPACRRTASRCSSSRGGACTPTPACTWRPSSTSRRNGR